MTFQRQLNWTGAMRDLRAQRTPAKPSFLAARSLAKAKAECELRAIHARPLVVNGALRSALRFVWMRAKMARAAAAH